MKTIILILVLLVYSVNSSYSKEVKSFRDVRTIEEYRYVNFMLCGKDEVIREDSDSRLEGEEFIYFRTLRLWDNYKKKIKKENMKNSKFKSIYLDFTILQEENIS